MKTKYHHRTRNTASIALFLLIFCGDLAAQPPPPPGRRPPPNQLGRRGGPGPGPGRATALDRAVNDLGLPENKREALAGAVQMHNDNVRRLHDLAAAQLVLSLKGTLSPEDFKKFKGATDGLRSGPNGGPILTTDNVVERIMAFDQTKAGMVRASDLPERMQPLVAKGDLNHDGALDRDEVKRLAAGMPAENPAPLPPRGRGRGRAGGPNPPPGAGRGGAGGTIPAGALERAVGDLNLSGITLETANAALKTHQDNVSKLTQLARADLLLKAGDILDDNELKRFTEVMNRPPPAGGRGERGPNRPPGRGD